MRRLIVPNPRKDAIAKRLSGYLYSKVSEAEVMFKHGIDPFVTTTNVTSTKIKRAMALHEANPEFIQATDSEQNARLLSDAAGAMGLTADVVIDVDPGGHRTGITPGQPALALAQLIDQLPGLRYVGCCATTADRST